MSNIKVYSINQLKDIFTEVKDKVNSLQMIRKYLYMNSHWENNNVLSFISRDTSATLSYTTSDSKNILVLTSCIDNYYSETGGNKTITTDGEYIVPDYNYNASDYSPIQVDTGVWSPSFGHIGIAQIHLDAGESISTQISLKSGTVYGTAAIFYIPIQNGISVNYVTSGTFNNTQNLSYDYTLTSGHYLAVMCNRKYEPGASLQEYKIKLDGNDIENTQYQNPSTRDSNYDPSFRIAEFEIDGSGIVSFSKKSSGSFEHIFIILKFID